VTIEMTTLNPAERSRTYTFQNKETITLTNVTHLAVSASGTHRLKTADGHLHIVPVGFLHIDIDADDWTL
jgi:hypothetical protein